MQEVFTWHMLLRSRLNKAKCWPELINKGLEKEMSQEQKLFYTTL